MKILFISHDASRTGAPIIFLNFLRWFRDNASIPFRIMLRNGGELEPDFQALGPVNVFNRKTFGGNKLAKKAILFPSIQRIANRIHLNSLKKQLAQNNIGLIYSNTVTNGDVLEFLSFLDCPIITHVHELENYIRQTGSMNFSYVKKHTQHYIAVSEAVKNNLVQNHGIPESRIDVVHGFIPVQNHNSLSEHASRRLIRKHLNIGEDILIVGACGTTDWRKAPDLFIQLAKTVRQRQLKTSVHFVWVGGETQGTRFVKLWHDVKNTGLEQHIHFIGVKTNPLEYFAAFDVFALVSRVDPFPIVCLEAASVGKPIVCFDGAGGMKEFVEDDCGFVVPYLDIEAMAAKVLLLLNSDELRQRLGIRAAEKVRERHDIEIIAPRIVEIIERFTYAK